MTVETSELDLFAAPGDNDKSYHDYTELLFSQNSYLNFIHGSVQFDLLPFFESKLFNYFSKIQSIDELLFSHISQYLFELLQDFIVATMRPLDNLIFLGFSEKTIVDYFTSVDIGYATYNIAATMNSDNNINSLRSKFRLEIGTVLDRAIMMTLFTESMMTNSSYYSHCKTILQKLCLYIVHHTFSMWSCEQHISSKNSLLLKSDNFLIESLLPEFKSNIDTSLMVSSNIWDILLLYNNNDEERKTMKSQLLLILVAYKQHGLLRRYSSLLLNMVRYCNQHIIKSQCMKDFYQFCSSRLRLLHCISSYLESIQSHTCNLNENFYNQLRKILEEFIKCTSNNTSSKTMTTCDGKPYFCVDILGHSIDSLSQSSTYCSVSLSNIKDYDFSYAISVVCDSLCLVDSRISSLVSSGLNLRIAYNILERIVKLYKRMALSKSDLQRYVYS